MLYHLGTDHTGINQTQLDWCCRNLFYRMSEAHLTDHALLRTSLKIHRMSLPSVISKGQMMEASSRQQIVSSTSQGSLCPSHSTSSPHTQKPSRKTWKWRASAEICQWIFLWGYTKTPSRSLFCSSQRWGFSLPIHLKVYCSSEIFCCWWRSQHLEESSLTTCATRTPLGVMEQGLDSGGFKSLALLHL